MAKKENTSAAAKVAKAEKQAAKGAEDSKLTSAQKVAKAEKSKAKAAKPKNPNGNIFQRFVKGFKKFWKDFRGEIKKITWPGAKTVLKNTGVVLVSVAVVGVVIYAIDQGLSFLVSKLIELAQKTGENKETAAAILSMINLGLYRRKTRCLLMPNGMWCTPIPATRIRSPQISKKWSRTVKCRIRSLRFRSPPRSSPR